MKNVETVKCGSITKKKLNSVVEVCGWIHRRRDHGGVIFFDLRDESGLAPSGLQPRRKGYFFLGRDL